MEWMNSVDEVGDFILVHEGLDSSVPVYMEGLTDEVRLRRNEFGFFVGEVQGMEELGDT